MNEDLRNYEISCEQIPIHFPPQHQVEKPGLEYLMNPRPIFNNPNYIGTGKLNNKVSIITGGDSGIGRAVAVAFAKEGSDIVIVYYNEHEDADETKKYVESLGRRCLTIAGDLKNEEFCKNIVNKTINTFGHIDVLVNNAGTATRQINFLDISKEQLYETFAVNIFSYFYMIKACLPYLKNGDSIVNTTSSSAYIGFPSLVDYSSSKGAVVGLTRSLAKEIIGKGIRVNAVAPGPTWTPLIVSGLPASAVPTFGSDTLMKRPAQTFELAPAYVYLASNDSSYVTGEVIHVTGGITYS